MGPDNSTMIHFSSAGSAHPRPHPLDLIADNAWAPGRSDLWWTIGVPIAVLMVVVGIHLALPRFYNAYVLPEGYGFLELSQFFLAGATAVLCVQALGYGVVKRSRLLWALMLLFALAAFYIAGEEHSWGQHFFNWSTPSEWSEINRQQETNLHNTSAWFNQRPKLVFDIAMFGGGLLVPLIQLRTGPFRPPLIQLMTPSLAIAAAAVIALAFKILDNASKGGVLDRIYSRPSEVMEMYQYFYMLSYVIVLRRRIRALDAAGVRTVGLQS